MTSEPRPWDSLPVVPNVPMLGWLPAFRSDALGAVRNLAAHGPLVRYRVAHHEFVLVTDPEATHQVFVSGAYVKSPLMYDKLGLLLGDGLINIDGDLWKRMRAIAQPAFHPSRIQGFAGIMRDRSIDAVESIRARADGPIDIVSEMQALTLRIIAETMFGSELGDEVDRVCRALPVALHEVDRFLDSLVPRPELWPGYGLEGDARAA
ncbi:MAG: cytochrome P450 [Alphaproteobacteria bacterium]|nr:cytochrome P450 [Alphaproteobacteria bacterium]